MEHEKYSYVESLRWLAEKYNVEIEESEVSPEAKVQQLVSDSLYIINNFAQKYFSDQLLNSPEGEDVGMTYLKERGFRGDIIEKFQLGYNPDNRHSFSTAAFEAQYQPELLERSGLVVNRDGNVFDNYRGRIIFPVHNASGKIAGFGARLIRKNDKAPKYINTPENEIYVKSRILYGSWFARQAIDKFDECLLVEGYTDVVSMHQEGIENVVASGGTSLTPDQLRLVKKYTKNLTIIYDGDAAGINAALRGLNMAVEEGLNVYLVMLPENEDPDSYVKKLGGGKFANFLKENKRDSIVFQIERAAVEAGSDATKKTELVKALAETISKFNRAEDFIKQQDYIRKTAEMLQIDERGMTNLVNSYLREKIRKADKKFIPERDFNSSLTPQEYPEDDTEIVSKDDVHERAVVRCLLEYGLNEWEENKNVAEYLLYEILDDEVVNDLELQKIIKIYRTLYESKLEPTIKNFLYSDDLVMSKLVTSLIEFPYQVSPGWEEHYERPMVSREDNYKKDIRSTLNYLELQKIRALLKQNETELSETASHERQMLLIQTQNHLKNLEMEITSQMGMVILK